LTIEGPRLDYDLDFQSTGRYFIYIRARVNDEINNGTSDDDSLLIGMDGNLISNQGYGVSGFVEREWLWEGSYWNSISEVNISRSGTHTFNIWMRENGLVVDRIFLINADELGISRPTDETVNAIWDFINWENPGWAPSCNEYMVPTPTLTPTRTPTITLTTTPYCPPGVCTPTYTPPPTNTPTPVPTKTDTPSPTPTREVSPTPLPPPSSTPTARPSATATQQQLPTITPTPTPTRTPPFGG
jgi:hypothetical protein